MINQRPTQHDDTALDDAPRPRPPHFVRRALDAVGITTTAAPSLREAEEAARAARVDEQAATQRAREARQARQAAEQAIGPAKAQAKAIEADTTRQGRARLDALEQALAQAQELEASDRARPSPAHRVRARMLLLGGTESASQEQPFSSAEALTSIATIDRVTGAFLEVSQAGGRLMKWIFDSDGATEALMDEADRLECAGWAGVMRRVRFLAGES